MSLFPKIKGRLPSNMHRLMNEGISKVQRNPATFRKKQEVLLWQQCADTKHRFPEAKNNPPTFSDQYSASIYLFQVSAMC